MSHPTKKRHKKHEHEEHENHERWLVTYADMLTVPMALFIVMFALSTADKTKFTAMAEGMANGLGGPVGVITGSKYAMDNKSDTLETLDLMTAAKPPLDSSLERALTAEDDRKRLQAKQEARAEAERLRALQKKLEKALEEAKIPGAARFRIDERGLVISIVTDKVLFEADRAELQPGGRKVLATVSPVLAGTPNGLLVEGHTNNVNVKPKYYPSEWELSGARAASVVRYLIGEHGLAAKRFTAVGYGNQRPLYPDSDPRARDLNRRVEVIVQTTLPATSRHLLAGEAKVAAAEEAERASADAGHGAEADAGGGSH